MAMVEVRKEGVAVGFTAKEIIPVMAFVEQVLNASRQLWNDEESGLEIRDSASSIEELAGRMLVVCYKNVIEEMEADPDKMAEVMFSAIVEENGKQRSSDSMYG